MARPLSPVKRVRDAVANIVVKIAGGLEAYFKGSLSLEVEKLEKFGQAGRLLAEKPTRDLDEFYFIHDVMANSPAVNAAITKMSEDATLDEKGDAVGLGFMVKVEPLDSESEDSQKTARDFKRELVALIEDFVLRTRIGYNAKHYVRKMLYAGDCFAENHIYLDSETGFGRIELVRELPTFQMRPIWDERGTLTGYKQSMYLRDKDPVVWDVPAQIIHWKHESCDYYDLGRSILAKFKQRWDDYKIIAMDLIAAIHTRAVAPEVHYLGRKTGLDTVSDTAIEEYYQKLFDNPADTRRYYVVREGQTRIEFPKTGDAANLEALLKIWRSFEMSFVEALGVPGILSGNIEAASGRHIANSMDQDYARRINSIRQDFSVALRPVVLLELALQGYDLTPDGLQTKHGVKRVTITPLWPDLAETPTQKIARLALQWGAGMKSLESCLREEGNQDPEGEIELILSERKRGISPVQVGGGFGEQGISPNGEQGKGVPNQQGDTSSSDKKKQTAERRYQRKYKSLLRAMLDLEDDED